jgi:hypothetical protein
MKISWNILTATGVTIQDQIFMEIPDAHNNQY